MSGNLVGIDIGGTKILIILSDINGHIKKQVEIPTTSEYPGAILGRIVLELKTFGKIDSIGIGIAGDIDSKNGILRFSPNLLKWKNVRLKKYFESKMKVPTIVENDANCAAYGSYVLDGERKYKNLITITLGTGIGGGIIIDGKLYRGSTGTAGEVGHITINPDGPKCNCGNNGCLETYIGKKGIMNIAKKVGFHKKNLTPAIIADEARKGNKKAKSIFNKVSEYLAAGVGSLVNIFNPDMITFSGGISNNWDLIEKILKRDLKKRTFKTPLEHVKIIKSSNNKNLGAIGAAFLSKER
ncbi:MAG: ROK family protein [Elusimicrobia bacterium]|nr:ROK family protein [Elusimicrobiota bacterium]